MNKAQIIIGLSEIKSSINKAHFETTDEIERLQHNVANFVDSIIIDLMDEGRENETCCACKDCPVMKKVDDLIEATKLREWLAETASKTALEVEKMARGGTD